MAYVLSESQSKRVKQFDQQGHQELEEGDARTFQQAAETAAQVLRANERALQPKFKCAEEPFCAQAAVAGDTIPDDNDAATPTAAVTPREVIEKLAAAKASTLYCCQTLSFPPTACSAQKHTKTASGLIV